MCSWEVSASENHLWTNIQWRGDRAGSSLFFQARAEPEPRFLGPSRARATNIFASSHHEPKISTFEPTSSQKIYPFEPNLSLNFSHLNSIYYYLILRGSVNIMLTFLDLNFYGFSDVSSLSKKFDPKLSLSKSSSQKIIASSLGKLPKSLAWSSRASKNTWFSSLNSSRA